MRDEHARFNIPILYRMTKIFELYGNSGGYTLLLCIIFGTLLLLFISNVSVQREISITLYIYYNIILSYIL